MAGALRMIGKVENAITKQVTQRMVESEPWFEERTNQVNALQVFSRIFCMQKHMILGLEEFQFKLKMVQHQVN